MTIEPRSANLTPPAHDPGDPVLVDLIRSEIERGGPITFARFMERALYEPELGYYATSAERPTRQGDFLTAPELHPIFGWAIAAQIDEMWRRLGEPEEFVLREYGAGSGALGSAVGDGLARAGSPLAGLLRYEPVEIEGRLPPGGRVARMVGCVIGNEFLDALPVHRVVWQAGRLLELYVDWRADRFEEVPGELSDERIAHQTEARTGLAEGQRAEVNLAMSDWLAKVAAELERGFVLLVDYGLPRTELRSAARATGTIRAFRGHQLSSDVLGGVGRRDITAHIDLDALEDDARSAGLDVLGRTTQAEFLVGCGLDEIYRAARAGADLEWEPALALRSAVRRLLDPRQLGGYAVVVLGKGVDEGQPAMRGLAYRLRGTE